MFFKIFTALSSNKAQLEFLIGTEWDACFASEYEHSSLLSIIVLLSESLWRVTSWSWCDVLIVYFCEIIHEGAEWLEVHSRSAVKGKYACVGAMLLEENGSGRSNYSYSYFFLFYLISNKHAFLNFPSTKKTKKNTTPPPLYIHTATTIYPRLWDSNLG